MSRDVARRAAVLTVGVLVAVVALAAVFWPSGRAVATEVRFTPEQQARYQSEMKENLDGRPRHPRSQLVTNEVLVQQGVLACRWLATQPARDEARREPEIRRGYFADHPRVIGAWSFKQGRTGIREEILTNAWGWLCPDIRGDRIDDSPVPED